VNAENCIINNTDGKLAGKEAKVSELYLPGGKCVGPYAIQQGAATGIAAHRGAIEDLAHDLFGNPVANTFDPGSPDDKCQDKAIHRATQLFTEQMKVFRKCKKDGMKDNVVTNSANLETECMSEPGIPDPSLKIAGKRQKLIDDVNDNCGMISIPTRFSGVCADSVGAAGLGACISRQTNCRVCLALNEADGTDADCDIFDDGISNGSCGIVFHTCVLDDVPPTDSQVTLYLPFLPAQNLPISGALQIGAGGDSVECVLEPFDAINVSMIGFVCITPGGECPAGARHCGPGAGPPLGVDWQSDGNIGACTSTAQCKSSCATFCGPGKISSGECTGHCTEGETICTVDAQCTPGNEEICGGPDLLTPAQTNICQCHCINTAAHGPSDPGDMQCQISINLTVETAAPCDATDTILNAGTQCGPISTQRATAMVTDANFFGGLTIPTSGTNDQTGVPIACSTVDTSTLTGLTGVGVLNFFSVPTLNDISAGLKATCL
jgi:hypothetical protein